MKSHKAARAHVSANGSGRHIRTPIIYKRHQIVTNQGAVNRFFCQNTKDDINPLSTTNFASLVLLIAIVSTNHGQG